MNFCQTHWDLLREKVAAAGLNALVADNGVEVAERMQRQLQGEVTTLSNYDPLMSAMFALTNHAFSNLGPANTRRVLLEGHCPVCIANHVHELNCQEEGCQLKFERFFDNAVVDEVERSKVLLRGGEA